MNLDHCWIDDLKDVLKSVQQSDWKQVIPLREDNSLCQLSSLADIHNTIEFTVKRRGQLNEVQEVKFKKKLQITEYILLSISVSFHSLRAFIKQFRNICFCLQPSILKLFLLHCLYYFSSPPFIRIPCSVMKRSPYKMGDIS